MKTDKLDKRKARRLKRRAATKERIFNLGYGLYTTESDLTELVEATLCTLEEYRNQPRVLRCTISRDQGQTWTEEYIDVAITDPKLSTLKIGDLVKYEEEETICAIVANEGENKVNASYFVPEGHLYWKA